MPTSARGAKKGATEGASGQAAFRRAVRAFRGRVSYGPVAIISRRSSGRRPPGARAAQLAPCRLGLYPLRRWGARGQVRPPLSRKAPEATRKPEGSRMPEPRSHRTILDHRPPAPRPAALRAAPRGARARAAGRGSGHKRGAQAAVSRALWNRGGGGARDWRLVAELGATVVQPCVVTLAPVTTPHRHACDAPLPRGLAGAHGRRGRDARGRHDRARCPRGSTSAR